MYAVLGDNVYNVGFYLPIKDEEDTIKFSYFHLNKEAGK